MQHRSLRSLRSHGLRHARSAHAPSGRTGSLSGVALLRIKNATSIAPLTPLARLTPRSPHAHASLWLHGLFKWCRFAPNKKTQGYIVSKLLKYNYDIFIQVFINKY